MKQIEYKYILRKFDIWIELMKEYKDEIKMRRK